MGLSRRLFLKCFLGAAVLTDAVLQFKTRIFAASVPLPTHPYRDTLSAFMDTLLPADQTPSATQLGVTDQLLTQAAKDNRFDRLLSQGCAWLDDQAQKKEGTVFAGLDEVARHRVAALAAHSPPKSFPHLFFEKLREDGFFFYYAHPKSWAALEYSGPPQPRGFMDYSSPPKPRQ